MLALARANDLVVLAKAISLQQHTILAASNDTLLVVMAVLQNVGGDAELSDALGSPWAAADR